MFAAGSFAEDRLSLTGRLDVFAWSQDGYTARDSQTFNDNDEIDYCQQRFRTQATIKVADDVKMVTRFDIGEADWGIDYRGAITRPNNNKARGSNKIDFDRAYAQVDKEMFSLTVGQQYVGIGMTEVLDSQPVGVKAVLKFDPVKVALVYAKLDEGASISDEGAANEDMDLYAVNVSFDMDNVALNVYGITINDDTAADDAPVAVGVMAKSTLGAVNVMGEVTGWFGDTMKNGFKQDYSGFQVYLGANSNLSDALKVGADLFYAQGADGTDLQKATFADFTAFDPFSMHTPVANFISPGSISGGSIMDFTGSMAGVQGLGVWGEFKAMEDLRVGGQIGYLQPEEDSNTIIDSAIVANAFIAYKIATNTEVSFTYFYVSPDEESGSPSLDDSTAMVLHFRLNF
jgi:hypothetical protein